MWLETRVCDELRVGDVTTGGGSGARGGGPLVRPLSLKSEDGGRIRGGGGRHDIAGGAGLGVLGADCVPVRTAAQVYRALA